MRAIERVGRFRRDYRRELKGLHASDLNARLASVVRALSTDAPLPPELRDHALSGDMAGLRDRHIRPDLILIYAKPDPDTLRLMRLGLHSEIFR